MDQLGKSSQYRLQKISVTVADGSPAGNYGNNIQLDRQFNKIVGIGFAQITDGGIADQYDVGAKTERQTWMDPVNVNFWTANGNVGPMEKYYKVNIPYGSGDTFYAMINTYAATSGSDLAAQMVLILEKDLTEVPR